MFQTKIAEEIKPHMLWSITFFSGKKYRLWENVENFCRTGQATDDNTAHAYCVLDTWGYKHTLVILIAFPQQQWLRERVSLLGYTYIAWIVILA
jgi:hypothetical protein